MNKIIITGVTGFIGLSLAKKFLQNDDNYVYGVGRNKEMLGQLLKHKNFMFISTDYSEYDNLAGKINISDADVFYHLSWMGYGKSTNDFNVQIKNIDATCKAISEAKKLGCKKFIFACSCSQYQKDPGTQQLNSVYGVTKTSAALYAKVLANTLHIEYNGAIFSNIFGVGDRSSRSTNTLIKQMNSNIVPKLVKGDNLYDWVYIDDAVNGLIAIWQKGINGKEYYVGHRKLLQFKEIVKKVQEVVAPKMALEFGGYPSNSYVDYSLINLDDLYTDTGFQCTSDFKDSIGKTLNWIKALTEGNK